MDERLERARVIHETDPDGALRLCSDALNEDKDDAQALYIAAKTLMLADRTGLAYTLFRRCNELRPRQSDIQNSMGLSIEHAHPEESLKCYENAIRLNPDNYHALNNKGLMMLRKGRPDLCIKYSNQAIALKPRPGDKVNRATAHLMMRNWKQGWDDYTHTLGVSRTRREYGVPDWNGEPGTVVVYGEQGLGDEIIFSSCIPDLQKTNKVIIDCEPRLVGLFERSFNCPVYGTRFKERTPLVDEHEIDFQVAIGALPGFFRNTDESFPGTPFLTPDPERALQWRALFTEGKTIGIAWQGGIPSTQRSDRSFDLDVMAPLFDLPHTFISLEYDEPDLKGYPVKHYSRAVNKGVDFDDTAALMSELDLVISVPTTAIHAAGGLGVECWCLVPKVPSYRYHLDGEMPWYNSVKLFRKQDTWEGLILQVKQALENKWQSRIALIQ